MGEKFGYPGIPTQYAKDPRTELTNASLTPRKPLTITKLPAQIGPRPYAPSRDAQLLDEALASGASADSILAEAMRAASDPRLGLDAEAYSDAQRMSDATRERSAGMPMPTGRDAIMSAAIPFAMAGGPVGMGASALLGGTAAMDFMEDPSITNAALGLAGAYPLMKPVARGLGTAIKAGTSYGGKALTGLKQAVTKAPTHAERLATGQQRTGQAKLGHEILRNERGVPNPSVSYDRTLRQHAAEAEGIPSANMRGSRRVTDVSQNNRLPGDYEPRWPGIVSPEQIKQHSYPQEYLNQLGRMLGRMSRGF